MGLAYVFALIVGVGIVAVQMALGAREQGGDGHEAGHDHDADHAPDAGAAHTALDFASLFLSVRFWIFASLAFGLTGSIAHWFELASPLVTALLAVGMGVGSGLLAAWSMRALRRASPQTHASVDEAVGKVGRVLVPVQKGSPGRVRVQLRGQSVDITATTDELELALGEAILVEEMEGGVARVSKRPIELE